MPTLPMSYTTVAVIQEILPTIMQSITTMTSAQIVDMGGMAQAEINGILARQYTLPFTVDVPLLTAAATNLTAYYMMRRQFTQEKENESDWPGQFKDRATEILAKIMDMEVELTSSSGQIISRRTDIVEAWSNTSGYVPTFAELAPQNLRIDPDKEDDLEADRDD